jgi:vacuolar protein sorting-associated protein VTA1
MDHEAMASDTASRHHIEQFAQRILDAADVGGVSMRTVKAYLAAATFLEAANGLGAPSDANLEKIKYCKWKATTVMKELKQGAKGNLIDLGSTRVEPRPASPPAMVPLTPTVSSAPPALSPVSPVFMTQQPPVPSAPPISPPKQQPAVQWSPPQVTMDTATAEKATKHARFAISALQYEDVPTAITNLRQALALLEPFNPQLYS